MSRTKRPNQHSEDPWIEQSDLGDECPCGSHLQFGACCGSNIDCDCRSHRLAGECCYNPEAEEGLKSI